MCCKNALKCYGKNAIIAKHFKRSTNYTKHFEKNCELVNNTQIEQNNNKHFENLYEKDLKSNDTQLRQSASWKMIIKELVIHINTLTEQIIIYAITNILKMLYQK